MPFPSNPTNGQTATVNNVNYQYDGVAWDRLTSASTAAPVLFSGNLLPSANVTYDIGTTTNRFRSLYLSGNTIDVGGATIKTDATTGAIALIAQPTTANPNPTGIVVSPTGAVATVATTAGVPNAGAIATASNAATPTTTIPLISNVVVTNSSWTVLDDTAVATTGGYIRLTGSGFDATSTVLFNNTSASAVTYGNSTTLYVQVPALSSSSYNIYVVNSTGATGIRVNGVTSSQFTAWSTGATLANVQTTQSFGVNLSATSDSTITYANTTSLPAGTTLASNGYFYGTITVGSQTTYSFDVKATDAENQDASRTFSLTVTVVPPSYLYTWGAAGAGRLGTNDITYRSSPTQIGTASWGNVAGLSYAGFGIKSTDGTLWSWGQNTYGQLGDNTSINRSSPAQVGSGTTWSNIVTGWYHAIALKTDGTLWTWGRNTYGQLGLGDTVDRSSPTQVGTATNWSKISGGLYGTLAVKTDGTLWCWGWANGGGLGTNDQVDRSSPTQVGSLNTWATGSMSTRVTFAIKTDGTLWGFGGDGFNGTMGLGVFDASYRSSPVQIGALTNWSRVGVFNYTALATKTNGTLWTWGRNNSGQLGINSTANANSPTQVGSDTNWSIISAGGVTQASIKTNGTLWTWGRNAEGQIGQNNVIYRSSPTQVGAGTTWLTVSAGYHMVATATSA